MDNCTIEKCKENEVRIRTLEQHQIGMASDIKHIKETLQNGLMTKIDQILSTLGAFKEDIQRNTFASNENTKFRLSLTNRFIIIVFGVIGGGIITVIIANAIK